LGKSPLELGDRLRQLRRGFGLTFKSGESAEAESQSELPRRSETDQFNQAIDQLEAETQKLEAAFGELSNLQSQQAELEHALTQASEDEKLILADSSTTEEKSVKKLVEARARRDIRRERLLAHQKRISNHCNLIVYDIA
jgi:hypothetical protein